MNNICPKCGGRKFNVDAHLETTAVIEFCEERDHIVHDETQGNLIWDDDDTAFCRNCGHEAPLGQMVQP